MVEQQEGTSSTEERKVSQQDATPAAQRVNEEKEKTDTLEEHRLSRDASEAVGKEDVHDGNGNDAEGAPERKRPNESQDLSVGESKPRSDGSGGGGGGGGGVGGGGVESDAKEATGGEEKDVAATPEDTTAGEEDGEDLNLNFDAEASKRVMCGLDKYVCYFLDASSHLYKRVRPSVRPSVHPSVGPSGRNAFSKPSRMSLLFEKNSRYHPLRIGVLFRHQYQNKRQQKGQDQKTLLYTLACTRAHLRQQQQRR